MIIDPPPPRIWEIDSQRLGGMREEDLYHSPDVTVGVGRVHSSLRAMNQEQPSGALAKAGSIEDGSMQAARGDAVTDTVEGEATAAPVD